MHKLHTLMKHPCLMKYKLYNYIDNNILIFWSYLLLSTLCFSFSTLLIYIVANIHQDFGRQSVIFFFTSLVSSLLAEIKFSYSTDATKRHQTAITRDFKTCFWIG